MTLLILPLTSKDVEHPLRVLRARLRVHAAQLCRVLVGQGMRSIPMQTCSGLAPAAARHNRVFLFRTILMVLEMGQRGGKRGGGGGEGIFSIEAI